MPPHRVQIRIGSVPYPILTATSPQQLYRTPITTNASPSSPDLLPRLKFPPCANSRLSLTPGIGLRQNLIFNISLSTAGNTRPSLYPGFLIQSSHHLSISIHSLEFGVGRGYFYCIKISQYSLKFPSSLLSFPFCFSGCISPLRIDHFSNPFLPLPPLISIIDGRVV